jgi:hypothetical protein
MDSQIIPHEVGRHDSQAGSQMIYHHHVKIANDKLEVEGG